MIFPYGRTVGSVRGYEENDTCYVERLMVHPNYQRVGIGKKLMLEYFPTCHRFELYTGGKNLINIHLFFTYKGTCVRLKGDKLSIP
ncbi:GNAT family N-acetyltransferase [Halalkalibacterium ligniniphilum]|uniref:GNAT family N-acetyltransferase n=1 Tax=Halalkalibacterium ligniniphilum TaxID=1134413 RepID=UPI0009DB09B8